MNRLLRIQSHLSSGRSMHASAKSLNTLKNITVYGSGLMGAGIVQIAASAKCAVTMVDTNQDALDRGHSIILTSLTRIAKKKFATDAAAQSKYIADILANIKTTTDASDAAKNADLIVEAIVENMAVKQKLFKQIDSVAPKGCILASNTSSLRVTDIAMACEGRKEMFAGLHFFNPVPQMKLVEIIRTIDTNESVTQKLVEFCKHVGKEPVLCKDTPGFIVNRLLVPYMMEALRMGERGDATIQDIDTAMKLGAGYPMGPFELMDYVGLDTIKFITDGWFKNGEGLKGLKIVEPSKMLNDIVAKGDFGRKSGKGFYNYEVKK